MVRLLLLLLGLHVTAAWSAEPVAMITGLEGSANLQLFGNVKPLSAFEKLRPGDVIALPRHSRLRIVFFASQRQEIWEGTGQLEIERERGSGTGLVGPEIRILPPALTAQIARTPSPDDPARARGLRMRSIAPAGDADKLDQEYRRLRSEATAEDINPELFLLAGLFEMREFERLDQVLEELNESRPGNLEVAVLKSLYKKAVTQKQPH